MTYIDPDNFEYSVMHFLCDMFYMYMGYNISSILLENENYSKGTRFSLYENYLNSNTSGSFYFSDKKFNVAFKPMKQECYSSECIKDGVSIKIIQIHNIPNVQYYKTNNDTYFMAEIVCKFTFDNELCETDDKCNTELLEIEYVSCSDISKRLRLNFDKTKNPVNESFKNTYNVTLVNYYIFKEEDCVLRERPYNERGFPYMVHYLDLDTHNVIETFYDHKSMLSLREMYKWFIDNNIKVDYYGDIINDEDLIYFKMKFGE